MFTHRYHKVDASLLNLLSVKRSAAAAKLFGISYLIQGCWEMLRMDNSQCFRDRCCVEWWILLSTAELIHSAEESTFMQQQTLLQNYFYSSPISLIGFLGSNSVVTHLVTLF